MEVLYIWGSNRVLPNFLVAHTDYERVEAYDEEPLNKTAQNQPKAQKLLQTSWFQANFAVYLWSLSSAANQ